MDSAMAEAKPPATEREGSISLSERDQLMRLLNFLEKDKINLGDVKVLLVPFSLIYSVFLF